jgi:LuxR family maltose regulon positive regulatory protein
VGLLLDQGPPALRLVVVGREEPPLPLARMRARRQLAELRAADLCWNVAEAAAYFNERLGLGLEPAQVAELVELTEGWVAGLSLAALALETAPRLGMPVTYPSRTPLAYEASGLEAWRFIADYLVSEVLEREPVVAQRFLLQTSLLDDLSGPLVEDVLLPEEGTAERAELLGGFPSGQAALETFERRGIFLFPAEDRPGVYRYHRLFAETLRAQLQRRLPERAAELTRRRAAVVGAPGEDPRSARPAAGVFSGPAEPLSEREHELLGLIAAGKPNREVADRLVITESTVKSHLKHIFAKLGARNRTEAVAIARDLQIIDI